MIRNITVDGEEALAVDTAEELGRALLTGGVGARIPRPR